MRLALPLLLLLAACTPIGSGPSPSPSPPPEGTGRPSSLVPASLQPTPVGGSTSVPRPGTIGEVDRKMVDALIQQASEETGVEADEISVVTAEAVTWNDGSLGCPEPGMAYTQALVSGYRVVLDVAGEEIHYHAGSDADFFACDEPQDPVDDGTVDR